MANFCNSILTTAFMVLAANPVSAQDHYATAQLRETAKLLQSRGGTPDVGGIHLMKGVPGGRYEVRLDSLNRVVHIGVPVVNREIARFQPSPVYDFVERYLLRLSFLDATERRLLLNDDKVTLTGNVNAVDTLCGVGLSSDDKRFNVIFTREGKNVASVSLPRNYELVTGKNKIESEACFRDEVLASSTDEALVDPSVSSDEVTSTDSVVYTQRSGYYIIKAMSANRYYLKDASGTLIPVNSINYPMETISNLFGQIISGNYMLNIEQRMYGRKTDNFAVSMAQFTSYCRSTGCQSYVGIESIDEKMVKATILYVNRTLNYNHLLYVTIPTDVLKKKSGDITAMLYCYIPTQNIRSLFQPKELKQRK